MRMEGVGISAMAFNLNGFNFNQSMMDSIAMNKVDGIVDFV